MRKIPAADFTRNFSQYRDLAQREPVAVTSDGLTMGYFVSAVEFEELLRVKARARRSRAVADLTKDEIEQMTSSRMSADHDHLNALLDEK